MKSKRIRELAAIHALRQSKLSLDDVKDVEVNGVHLDKDKIKARETRLEKGRARVDAKDANPNLFDKGMGVIEGRADQIRKTLGRLSEGEKVLASLSGNTERVERERNVTLRLKDGSSLEIPVRFVDARASQALYRMNQTGLVSSYVPMLGHVLPPLFAATSLFGGRVARWMGDDDLAQAATKTGQKQLQQSAALLIPVVDAALGALTLLKSYQDERATLREAVGAAEIASLSQQGKAQVPDSDAQNPLLAWVKTGPKSQTQSPES